MYSTCYQMTYCPFVFYHPHFVHSMPMAFVGPMRNISGWGGSKGNTINVSRLPGACAPYQFSEGNAETHPPSESWRAFSLNRSSTINRIQQSEEWGNAYPHKLKINHNKRQLTTRNTLQTFHLLLHPLNTCEGGWLNISLAKGESKLLQSQTDE